MSKHFVIICHVVILVFFGCGNVFAQNQTLTMLDTSAAIAISDYENLRQAVLNNNPQLRPRKKTIAPVYNLLFSMGEFQTSSSTLPEIVPDYENLRQTLLTITDPLERAIIIRNHVFSHITLLAPGEDYPEVPFERLYDNYMYSYDNPNYGHLCGGISIIFQSICEAFEIPTRYVGLFDEIDYDYNSHATSEVFYNGKWIAMDPTFNVMPKYNGEYISYGEIRILSSEGKLNDVVWDSNGYYIPGNRKILNYYIGMDKLTRYIAIQAARVLYQGEIIEYDRKAIPATWDMTVWNGAYLLGTAGEDIYYHFSWGEYRFQDMELMIAPKMYVPELNISEKLPRQEPGASLDFKR